MLLANLVAALAKKRVSSKENPDVTGIVSDSRQVQPGSLFVAVRGASADGHSYIGGAIQRGAVAVVGERRLDTPLPVPYIIVPDGRSALAYLSAAWYGFPARRLKMIGVTGTDGKTTTTTFIRAILEAAGHRAGMVSTVAASIGDRQVDTGFHTTTPDAPDIQRYLAEMAEAGAEYAVVETTSHGLDQKRVDACEFDVAAITNITHEHLDYHGSFEAYRAAKAGLFEMLKTAAHKPGQKKVAVLNADDPSYGFLRAIPAQLHLSYGLHGAGDVTAHNIRPHEHGTRFTAVTPVGSVPVEIFFPGGFNVSNALAATSVAVGLDLPLDAVREGLLAVRAITGRMEPIERGQDFTVIVDFAHTPNALEQALLVARGMTSGRVIVVFGCAGLRDRQKRPLMGAVAGRLADFTVITAEDPRTESLSQIMREIADGLGKEGCREGKDYVRIADREVAIAFAIGMAKQGDLVIITGKGHEQSMCFGAREYPWSDHAAAWAALAGVVERDG